MLCEQVLGDGVAAKGGGDPLISFSYREHDPALCFCSHFADG